MEITESSPLIERAWYTFPIVVYGAWMVKKRIEVNLGVKSLYHAHFAPKLLPILDLSLCVSLIMLAAGTTEIVGVAVSFAVAMISTIVALKYLSCKAFKPEFLRRREDPVAALIIAAAGVLNY